VIQPTGLSTKVSIDIPNHQKHPSGYARMGFSGSGLLETPLSLRGGGQGFGLAFELRAGCVSVHRCKWRDREEPPLFPTIRGAR
jgi:hypothetical protein